MLSKMRSTMIGSSLSLMCLVTACQRIDVIPPADVAVTNLARKEIGIRLISSKWGFYIREFGCEKWEEEDGLLAKVVQRDSDEIESRILWEEDYYYGSGTFVDPDGIVLRERVVVFYDHTVSRFFLFYIGNKRSAQEVIRDLSISDKGSAGSSNKETLKAADALLALIGHEK